QRQKKSHPFHYIIETMLSVIVVSYNTREVTLECLKRLSRAIEDFEDKTGSPVETIVIDNASTDGSAAAIKKRYPKVKVLINKKNTGFAAANNQGMAIARGEWLLLLNSDAFVFPDTLVKMVEFTDTNPECDVAGCQLLNQDLTLQQSWGYFPTLSRIILFMSFIDNFPVIRKYFRAIHVRDFSRYTKTTEADWVMGAFVWLKRTVREKTGGLDEKYFMYGEETEWMYRIKKAGFKVFFTPAAKCVHLKGASIKSMAKAFAGEAKGYIYWFSKHNPRWQQIILPWILIFGGIYKSIAWRVLDNKEWAGANFALSGEIWRATFEKSR
ncbi:MAG: Glycosyltransferase/rhamnosyltransferase, partial [Candidatus Amesbacteria bacterium GW2011_GWB1_47_19]